MNNYYRCTYILILILLITNPLHAKKLQIHQVLLGSAPGEPNLLLLESGRVLKSFQNFSINGKRSYISTQYTESDFHPIDNFNVSQLKSREELQRAYDYLDPRLNPAAECFNRAHLWSYALARTYDEAPVETGKQWLFFSEAYIREHDYPWWFHVAPYTLLEKSNEAIVLDPTYTEEPLRFTEWKNKFVLSHAPCKEMKRYHDFVAKDEQEDCFSLKTSMYLYRPYQIKNLQSGLQVKPLFLSYELEIAYKDTLY